MHKSRLATLVVDCKTDDLSREVDFWGQALGCSAGKSDDRYTWIDGEEDQVRVILQKVDHPSRVHIDIETDNIEAEVKRLESIGATIVERMEKWVVMEAPSKHRFCVIGPTRPDFEDRANTWD